MCARAHYMCKITLYVETTLYIYMILRLYLYFFSSFCRSYPYLRVGFHKVIGPCVRCTSARLRSGHLCPEKRLPHPNHVIDIVGSWFVVAEPFLFKQFSTRPRPRATGEKSSPPHSSDSCVAPGVSTRAPPPHSSASCVALS